MAIGDDDLDLTQEVFMEKTAITLADIAGLNMDEIKEERFENMPKGNFIFEVEKMWLGKFGEGEKAKGGVGFKAKVLEVINVNDKDFTGDPADLIGKMHQQVFFITQLKSVGFIKSFIKDIGAPYSPNFLKLLETATGTRFQGPISKRKDPNDTDKEYSSVVQAKVKPLGNAMGESSSVAAAVA